ncbi:MAG: hypothetical protein HY537_09690 [Deltaproteobacteria bacterium]|nr:hypothetical protein [Deltaproteobacteria bacterium]
MANSDSVLGVSADKWLKWMCFAPAVAVYLFFFANRHTHFTQFPFDLFCYLGLVLLALLLRALKSELKGYFALLCFFNILALYLLLVAKAEISRPAAIVGVATYLGILLIHWSLVRIFSAQRSKWALLPFFFPIACLVLFKTIFPLGMVYLIGFSYTAFRISFVVFEIRNRKVAMPTLFQYLSYAAFFPLLVVGPISRYETFLKGTEPNKDGSLISSALVAIERIAVGVVKCMCLAVLCNQLTFESLLPDAQYHPLIDFFIACIFDYFHLYFNFSGMCDIAIGLSGLMGIEVDENFDYPFLARNIKDFWNRWHITLSHFLRDVLFTPVTKSFLNKFGRRYQNPIISFGSLLVFITIGLWHGFQWNYVLLGLWHGLGFVVNQYYSVVLKRWLGPARFHAYLHNRFVSTLAISLTFLYISASFFFFANNTEKMARVMRILYGSSNW